MKVAIIGATGFVGGHILRVLRECGDEARAVVRNLRFAASDPDCRVADACDVYELRAAFEGCDYAVHAALGSTEVILGSVAPVYAAAQGAGVKRLVYISTGSVHGQSPRPGADERSRLTIFHPFAYNVAKVRAERKLRRVRRRGTVEIVILRPTIVFGPGSRWVFDFADALHANRAFVVDGARGICNSIYVDNLAHAVRLACLTPGIDGESILVSDEETVTWADLYRPIAEAFGYDGDAVPSFPPPAPRYDWKRRYVDPLRTSELAQMVLTRVPPGFKAGIRNTLRRLRSRRAPAAPSQSSGSTPAAIHTTSAPVISAEIAALHCCRWRLPHDKATRLLGYVAPVPFAEGCRRSVEWLKARAAANAVTSPSGDPSAF